MSYRELKSYQQATVIYDFTVEFCGRFIQPTNDKSNWSDSPRFAGEAGRTYRSYRTADQMIQAARSGKQNIVEGSTERTSRKSELHLLGVARASFQELLEDYEDFLRQRRLRQWGKDEPKAVEVRNLYKSDKSDSPRFAGEAGKSDRTNRTYQSYLSDPETAANAAICLIHQVNFLLDRQIKSLEEKFIEQGGYSESLRRAREEEKKRRLKRFFL